MNINYEIGRQAEKAKQVQSFVEAQTKIYLNEIFNDLNANRDALAYSVLSGQRISVSLGYDRGEYDLSVGTADNPYKSINRNLTPNFLQRKWRNLTGGLVLSVHPHDVKDFLESATKDELECFEGYREIQSYLEGAGKRLELKYFDKRKGAIGSRTSIDFQILDIN